MDLTEFSTFDAVGLAELILRGDLSAKEASNLAVDGIHLINPSLNAVNEVFEDRIDGPDNNVNRNGRLFGVPILNKDLSFAEAGRKQEMGSMFTKGFRPTTDSTTVERLRNAGVNIIGRTATPEFGNSGLTESVIQGVTRNPWDVNRTPGGSSGGSAAMVAAGCVPVATASDGGGSTRTPAAVCGLIGLKATRGLIPVGPRRGEGGSGLTGPFAVMRTMRDCAATLDVMAGPALGDAYVVQKPVSPYGTFIKQPMPRLRIAYSDHNWAGVQTSESSREALKFALQHLESEGHIIEEAFPDLKWSEFFEATIVVMCANLANSLDSLSAAMGIEPNPDNLQSSTWACYQLGKTYTSGDLLTALGQFNDVSRTMGTFMENHDVVVLPTNVFPAPLLEDCYQCNPSEPITGAQYQENVYSNDHFLALTNTTGQPSITLPLYQSKDGLPVGVQFVGRCAEDSVLLQIGAFFEQATPWINRRPAVHVSTQQHSSPLTLGL